MFGWNRGPPRQGGDGNNVTVKGEKVDLALYKYDSCPYCRRVHSAIDDLDVQVEYRDTRSDRQWRDDLLQKGGKTTVPCLFINGKPLYESADIIGWLKKNFSKKEGV